MNLERFCTEKEAFMLFLEREKQLSHHTLRAYASDLRQFIEFWQKTETREERTLAIQPIVERHVAALQSKKINKASIARKISCFHSYEKFIEQQHGYKLNLQLMRPRVEQKAPQFLTLDEIVYLLDGVSHHTMPTPFPARDKAIFELLYATGIRSSEIVAIRIKDLNFAKKTIAIQTSDKKERIVLFGSACEKKLLHYISQERTPIKHPAEYLFLNYRNEPLTTRSVQRICGMFGNFLAVKRAITPHMLRHSFATHMINQGADVHTLQELLGYKTIASTEKYTNLASENTMVTAVAFDSSINHTECSS